MASIKRMMQGVLLAGACALGAGPAMAWGDMYMGDGTNDPNSMMPQAYHGPNFCPSGLSPVTMGGVICCGIPATPLKMTKPSKMHTQSHAHHDPGKGAHLSHGMNGHNH